LELLDCNCWGFTRNDFGPLIATPMAQAIFRMQGKSKVILAWLSHRDFHTLLPNELDTEYGENKW
jgi:hypothetical protein